MPRFSPLCFRALLLLAAGIGAAGCAIAPPARVPAGRVVEFQIPAPSLGAARRSVLVYLPPSYARTGRARLYPVIYFLHGGPGWNGDWFRHGGLRELLDALIAQRRVPELIGIAPDGRGPGRDGRSLWINNWNGSARIEDFLVHDVVAWADSTLRTRADETDRALVGVSDGGGAALSLLMHHPDEFGECAGLSGRYHPHGPHGLEPVIGTSPRRDSVLAACSPALYASRVAARLAGHTIYFDAGVLDFDARDVALLDSRLAQLGVRHDARLYFGWHDWPWWRRRLVVCLPEIARGFEPQRGRSL